jgi:hypothetical protein
MALRVGIVRYEGFMHAWVLDIPGCASGADDEDGLGDALALSVAEHRAWLARHGIDAPGGPFEVVEDIDGTALADTGGEYCFAADREPVAATELEGLLRVAGLASTELRDAGRALPAEVLDWEPPESALGAADPWAPSIRTAREIFEHALQLEVYYRGGLAGGQGPGIFEAVDTPEVEAERTAGALRNAAARGGSSWVTRPGRASREEWTVRKVVRRLVAHHRTHAAEIEQRRTWVLLGAPVVERR